MHIITPYNAWSPKKNKKTWQEQMWEQQQIAEFEAKMLAEAQSRTLPSNSPATSLASAGPTVNAMAGGGGQLPVQYYSPRDNTIAFSVASNTGSAPFNVQFSNDSSPDAWQFDTWTWNLGDGTISNDKSPAHVYDTGSFIISLTGSSPSGIKSYSTTLTITSSLPTVVPSFTPLKSTGSVDGGNGYTVNFINTTGNGLSYNWTFSGSTKPVTPVTTSVATNPSITFYNTGSYTVTLNATGYYGVTGTTSVLAVLATT